MKPIERKDIRGPRLYEPIRDDLRRRVMELKTVRRVHVGPIVTLVFENRATLIFQIEEMLRAESIADEAKVLEEIAVYNSLVPGPGELSATLFVEITEQEKIRPTLNQLIGIDEHVLLELADGTRVQAQFEAGRSDGERISSVQYVRFPVGAEHAPALVKGPAHLHIEHPGYQHRVELSAATRAELARDLD